MYWVIKHRNKKQFWSTDSKSFNPKSDGCEAYFLEEEKLKKILPANGVWVRAVDFGMEGSNKNTIETSAKLFLHLFEGDKDKAIKFVEKTCKISEFLDDSISQEVARKVLALIKLSE